MKRAALGVIAQRNLGEKIKTTAPIFFQMEGILRNYRNTNVTMQEIYNESRGGNDVRHWYLFDKNPSQIYQQMGVDSEYSSGDESEENVCNIVGVCKTETVGYTDAAYLSSFVIAEGYRNRGYSSIFLKMIMNSLKNMNYSRVVLRVKEENYAAQNCYIGNGFRTIEKRNGRYIQERRL